jgi:putative ABC transport system ATP-binding protein
VSLEIEPGELVQVWGARCSGRSTLLAIAAGLERPDAGVVLFDGVDLSDWGADALGGGIGFCYLRAGSAGGRSVIDNVRAGLLGLGVPVRDADRRARKALERVGVGARDMGSLDAAEEVRVSIACALVLGPRMLVIDEPTKGVDLLVRDDLVLLLRSLADDGIAVLVSDGDGSGLCDADRVLSLTGGRLRGETSPVKMGMLLPLRGTGRGAAA